MRHVWYKWYFLQTVWSYEYPYEHIHTSTPPHLHTSTCKHTSSRLILSIVRDKHTCPLSGANDLFANLNIVKYWEHLTLTLNYLRDFRSEIIFPWSRLSPICYHSLTSPFALAHYRSLFLFEPYETNCIDYKVGVDFNFIYLFSLFKCTCVKFEWKTNAFFFCWRYVDDGDHVRQDDPHTQTKIKPVHEIHFQSSFARSFRCPPFFLDAPSNI